MSSFFGAEQSLLRLAKLNLNPLRTIDFWTYGCQSAAEIGVPCTIPLGGHASYDLRIFH